MKWVVLSLLCFMSFMSEGRSQQTVTDALDLDSIRRNTNKPLLVFVHTEWCSYCKLMMKTTFKNEVVSRVLNSYSVIYFNAEDRREVIFNSKRFSYKPTGANTGVHSFAEAIASFGGELSYPSIAILDHKSKVIFNYNGFLSAPALLEILQEAERKYKLALNN